MCDAPAQLVCLFVTSIIILLIVRSSTCMGDWLFMFVNSLCMLLVNG